MAHDEISGEARDLHQDALVWDMTIPIITPGDSGEQARVFSRAVGAGFDFVSITLAIDLFDYRAACKQVARYRSLISERQDAVLARSVDDIAGAKQAGKLAVGFNFQGTGPFEQELGFIDLCYELGIRHALMAYNQTNAVGSGCHVEEDAGVTPFGREVIAKMNEVGMLVDCAHTGHRTAMETIEASSSPVIVSHTNAFSLTEHDRCVRDEQIQAIAASGGVLGMTGLSTFLGEGEATVERFVDHIDHVAELVGPKFVGLGLDYVYDMPAFEAFVAQSSGVYGTGGSYEKMTQLEIEDAPRITQELLRRGYTEGEVRGILGENWLRVCRQVWK